jgi:DNA-directed RNA polymerase specialized sigma24 family protein
MSEMAAKTRWQLTQEAFDRLLAALFPAREAAGEKYLLLRKNLVRFFETRGIAEAEDAADEVLNRLARKLEGGERLENPHTYALGIARLVALELRKFPEKTAVDELPELAAPAPDEEASRGEEKLKCLEICLGELAPENRRVIVGYYRGEKREKIENRQRLAEELGVPANALRSRAVRLRDKLEACITGCLRGGGR